MSDSKHKNDNLLSHNIQALLIYIYRTICESRKTLNKYIHYTEGIVKFTNIVCVHMKFSKINIGLSRVAPDNL